MKKTEQYREFTTPRGLTERYYALTAPDGGDFREKASRLLAEYDDLPGNGGSDVMLRFHLSDPAAQAPYLRELLKGRNSFVSCIGQAPAYGGDIALEAWQIDGCRRKTLQDESIDALDMELEHYSLLLSGSARLASSGSHDQTREEFENLEALLSARKGTIECNLQRTWLYCRDIDNNYAGLVEARKVLFDKHGLTPDTHYVASTGIEGNMEEDNRLVKMDSLSMFGLQEGQVEYMETLDNMCPTSHYGVTFERGTRIIYGDRSVYYISGTASIDRFGDVLHIDDPARQTERAIHNIKAMMENHQGSITDMKQAVVYLRNLEDRDIVQDVLDHSVMADIPYILVKGPVCRPTWLVEIEGIAVNANGDARFADFA